ncbi:MAG: YHS domain-containing protein [Victivallales bacterium]
MEIGRKLLMTSTFIASTLIFTALAAYRPGDSSHVVSETTPEGGKARHGAHISYGTERCSVLVTSKVNLDRREDLKISVEGRNTPPFEIIGRNPSVLDVGIHDWPRIKGDTIYGVQKDKIAFYVVFKPPEKDPVCGMWMNCPESGDAAEYKGRIYQFCSEDCRKSFVEEPAKFADTQLKAEKCSIVLTDRQGRRVLTVPVDFSDPRSKSSESDASARSGSSHCPDGSMASGSGRPSGSKDHRGGMKQ